MVMVSPKHRFAVAIGALALVIAFAVALRPDGARATIVPVQPPCEPGQLCVYEHPDYGGQVVRIRRKGPSNALFADMPYEASSVKNRRNKIAYLYAFADGQGFRVCLEPREQIPNLDALGFDNQANSSKNVRRAEKCPRDLNGTCNRGEFCVYEHDNYVGKVVEFDEPGVSDKLERWMDDQASSARNKRPRRSVLLESPQGEPGAKFCVAAHSSANSVGPAFNDIASATRLERGRSAC